MKKVHRGVVQAIDPLAALPAHGVAATGASVFFCLEFRTPEDLFLDLIAFGQSNN